MEIAFDMKVAFDIGGLISHYPKEMTCMMRALRDGGIQVYIITDMPPETARITCKQNGLLDIIDEDHILSADWSKHGDRCKTAIMEERGISVLIDDRPDYVAEGDFIGLVLSPRPKVPYYAASWSNYLVPAVCVPPEEYDEFKEWKEKRDNEHA